MEYERRINILANRLNFTGINDLLVTDLASIRWLTGYEGSSASCLVSVDRQVTLVSDSRYNEYCQKLSAVEAGTVRFVEASPTDLGSTIAQRLVGKKVWFVSEQMTVATYDDLAKTLKLVKAEDDPVLTCRGKKDCAEIAQMREAIRIAEEAFSKTYEVYVDAMDGSSVFTELDFRSELDSAMIKLGASAPAFDSIVASGPNSLKPHSAPTNRAFQAGELAIVDWGAEVNGYKSDTSRTIWSGGLTPAQRKLFDTVARALDAGTSQIKPGATYGDVKVAADSIIEDAGYGEYILHPFGHNVGLDIHERPYFASTGADASNALEEGNVVALEPAAYVPGIGGVRLENLLQVTSAGVEIFNQLPTDIVN